MKSVGIIFLILCSSLTAQEWTVVPQRKPPKPEPRMCWVTHREPGHWDRTCVQIEINGCWYTTNRCSPWVYTPARTWKRLEPCPKRHILDQEESNGVVDPDGHPVESRNRSLFPSGRTRTTPTCD